MRKTAFSFLISLLMVSAIHAQQPRKFAVIVGCADYQMQNMDLRYSDDDAYRVYAYLKSCEGGSVPDENIAVLVDEAATKNNIINTMNDIFSKASPDDMLLFYFSGHGAESAFCPINTTDQYSSLLMHSDIKSVFKKYPSKYKICLADACFSGSIFQGMPASTTPTSTSSDANVVIIMSSKLTETSQENVKIRQGAFTYYLLKGLKGSADRDNDKVITLQELFPYIKANVLNFTSNAQTPVIEGNASRYMPIGTIN